MEQFVDEDAARTIERALDAGDTEEAADLFQVHLWDILICQYERTVDLYSRLPSEAIAQRPQLAYSWILGLPMSLIPSPGVTMQMDTARFPALEEVPAGSREAYRVSHMIAHRMRGEFAEAQQCATLVRASLHTRAPMRSGSQRRAIASILSQLGATELLAGDADQALRDFAEAATVNVGTQGRIITYDALVRSAMVHAAAGRLLMAEQQLIHATELGSLPEGQYRRRIRNREYIARALLAVERMDLIADLALARIDSDVETELWPMRLLVRSRFEIARGNPVSALDDADLADRVNVIPKGSLADSIVTSVRADALAAMGIASSAHRAVGSLAGIEQPLLWLAHVRELVLTAEPSIALTETHRLVAAPLMSPSVRTEAMLLSAWAHERLTGRVDEWAAQTAGAVMREQGLRRQLALVPESVRRAAGMSQKDLADVPSVAPVPRDSTSLTPRERKVLRLLAGPGDLAQIATELGVSINTVKSQVRSIYRRLGVNTRAAAVARALSRTPG